MRENDGRICGSGYLAAGNGLVLLQDNMEGLLKWTAITGWAAPGIRKVTDVVYQGSSSIQTYVNRTLANGISFYNAGRRIPSFSCGVINAEITVCSAVENLGLIPPIKVLAGCSLKLEWWDGTKRRLIGIQYDRYNETAKLFDENWYDDPIGDFSPGNKGLIWHRLWMKYDLGKDRYIEAGINGNVWDVSNHQAASVDDNSEVRANIMMGLGTYEVGRYFMYCDNAALVKVN
jgi:hypothetical protein